MHFLVAIATGLLFSMTAMAEDVPSESIQTLQIEEQTRRQKRIARKVDRIAQRRGLDPLDESVSEALQVQHAIRTRNVGRVVTTGGVSLLVVGSLTTASGVRLYRSLCAMDPTLCMFIGIPVGVAMGAAGVLGMATGLGTTSAGLLVTHEGKKQLKESNQSVRLRKRDAPSVD